MFLRFSPSWVRVSTAFRVGCFRLRAIRSSSIRLRRTPARRWPGFPARRLADVACRGDQLSCVDGGCSSNSARYRAPSPGLRLSYQATASRCSASASGWNRYVTGAMPAPSAVPLPRRPAPLLHAQFPRPAALLRRAKSRQARLPVDHRGSTAAAERGPHVHPVADPERHLVESWIS